MKDIKEITVCDVPWKMPIYGYARIFYLNKFTVYLLHLKLIT